jgi:TetR/AcrR family transcriptional repressor of nem operon
MIPSPATARQPAETPGRILDIAERLAQTLGFNGFSYADIAAEIGLTKASLHYHFPSKADLGRALITRYAERFEAALAEIDRRAGNERTKLWRFAEVYERVLLQDRMCLCGIFAAEVGSLPEAMRIELRRFFDLSEAWLGAVLLAGRTAGRLRFDGAPAETARALTAALQGTILLARAYEDPSRFRATARRLLESAIGS